MGRSLPGCVTSVEVLDRAVVLALRPEIIFCTFGDMLRVPGSRSDLARAKADGGDVRVVYSPMDALEVARQNPDCEIEFFAVVFETTALANAMAAFQA